MSSVKERLAALTPEQRAQLAQRLKGEPNAPETSFPLSDNQRALWLLYQLAPQSSAHNVAVAFRVRQRLDLAVLERCLEQLAARHAVLRTTYEVDAAGPRQRVQARSGVTLVHHVEEGLSEAQLPSRLRQSHQQPFDLSTGPVARMHVVSLAPEHHVLLFVAHHIATDMWSMCLMLEELQQLYLAERGGEPARLPPLPLDYAGYVRRQREELGGPRGQQLERYWMEQFRNGAAPLELPTDRLRPPVWSFRGAYHEVTLEPQTVARLRELAHSEKKTLSTLLLASFQVLLYRYIGRTDIPISTPVSGRTHPDAQRLSGYLANLVTINGDLEGNPTFREFLERVQGRLAGAMEHPDYPVRRLSERLGIRPDARGPQLTEVSFSLDQLDQLPGIGQGGVTPMGEFLPLLAQLGGQFDLHLHLVDTGEDLRGVVRYSPDLFEESTIRRLAGHYHRLLESILANPSQRVDGLRLLPDAERQQVLVEWNDTAVELPDRCLHELFEEQARATPDAVAVIFGQQRLSYAELNARANRLAHHLRALGVGVDSLVGLCMQRSLEMVVALVGIQKAGGAYVPLDPDHPRERLAFLLADTGAKVVLSESGLAGRFEGAQAQVVLLDRDREAIAARPDHTPSVEVHPSNLAYVIYTSGSTGRPKGVMIPHRGIRNRVLWAVREYRFTPADRMLQKTTLTFDAAGWEFYGPLVSGGAVVMAEPGVQKDPAAMVRAVAEHQVTVLQLVPSMLRLVVEEPGLASCTSLRLLFSAGEPLTTELCRGLLKRVKVEIVNTYGPTECSIDVTAWRHQAGELGDRIPIGQPLQNTRIRILDRNGGLAPVGVPGELHVGGVNLARCYLNQPELTAERFVPDPYASTPGERLYRTGDRCRWLPDGNIEFLGRLDHQVKLRGFRIELGEIETALGQHPRVKSAVVLVREVSAGDQQLVAYLVPRGEQPEASELRSFLRDRLPDYMVPSAFVMLEAWPLTASGKVDRQKLPELEGTQAAQRRAYVGPRTPTEELLAQVWAQVLHLEQVDINDDFFELGGHSLLATQVLSRVRATFRVEVPQEELFASPTVAGLALKVDAALRAGQGLQIPPLRPFPRTGELPLSFAQQRLWFLDQLVPNSSLYNILVSIRLEGALDVPVLEKSFGALLRRHESLRTTFRAERGQPVLVISSEATLPLKAVDLGHLPESAREDEVRRRAGEEAQKPFDLTRGPLMRGSLLRLAEREHVLLLTMHHIVSDGWSSGILVREVAALYQAFRSGQPSPLPELPIQYVDYAAWQRQWQQGELLEAQLAYWRQQLQGAPRALELPTDRPHPKMQTFRGANYTFALPRGLSESLKGLSRREYATDFMVLLAAFQALLHRYTGQDDFCLGSPIAGRNHQELESLVGLFINTLVLRTRLSGSLTFRELLGRTREATLGAYAHQDVPFEKLVEELQPMRDLSRPPLFQVLFVLQNAPLPELTLPGLAVRGFQAQETTTAKFELSLAFLETAQGFEGWVEYNTDLFERDTIVRMMGHLRTLLEGIVANPDQRLAELPLLTEDDRRKMLVEWNDTRTELPPDTCAHRLFERQVERTPDAVAVRFEGQQLTYLQLNRRANQLAHHLRTLGVGPEVRVALSVERSLELIIGMLGILKAGGAYVPLDPSYPSERLAWMLGDSAAPVLVTRRKTAETLPTLGEQRVYLDPEGEELSRQPEDNPASGVTPENLAYVIYTSGSTGQPKGTLLQHRGMCNTALATAKALGAGPEDRVLQFAPSSFDASVCEVFSTLLGGACLILAPREQLMPNTPLRTLLESERVTLTGLTPSVLANLESDGLPHLRKVISSGEPCTPELARRWTLGRTLLNAYGPTETTVLSTITPGPVSPERMTIGRAWPNTQLYVLDAGLRPVPVGVPGELYIGGVGLARGYQGRPELTAEKFVPDPFSEVPGARLYRTGDRVRWFSDGELDYLGRIDTQVKTRGFRIELGEVESVLAQHPAVHEAVVVIRQDVPGNPRLVAYVVMGAGQSAKAEELRAFLKEKLPEYMVPSAFVHLEAMPLSPNGKVDRKALPQPDEAAFGLQAHYVEPRTPAEIEVAAIWKQVLGLKQVGAEDDFFLAGGNSLLVTQVASRLRQTFQVALPLPRLFEATTVAALAAAVEEAIEAEVEGLSDEEVAKLLARTDSGN